MKPARTLKSVIQFRSARDFVKHYFEFRKSHDPSFGYKVFSNECGLKSASYLQMVISGQRTLSIDCVHKIASMAKLSFKEHQYLEAAAFLDAASDKVERSYYQKKLKALSAAPEAKTVQLKRVPLNPSLNSFDWKLMPLVAILAASPENFKTSDLAQRFQIDEIALKDQIEALRKFGLVRLDDGFIKLDLEGVTFHDSKDLKGFQKKILGQLLQFSNLAFDRHYENAKFYSHSFTADPRRIPELNEEIREFLAKLTKTGASHDSSEIVQINLQCFDLLKIGSQIS